MSPIMSMIDAANVDSAKENDGIGRRGRNTFHGHVLPPIPSPKAEEERRDFAVNIIQRADDDIVQ